MITGSLIGLSATETTSKKGVPLPATFTQLTKMSERSCHGFGIIFPNSVFPLKHPRLHSAHSFTPRPLVAGCRGEFEAQKGNQWVEIKNNLLETTMK